jgi:hypothetical protein
MVRMIATFFAVWLAIGAIGVLIQAIVIPIPDRAVGLIGLAIATAAAFVVYRRRNQQSR